MYTIIHTADWHLGQSFHGFDRDFEHASFLSWLLGELTIRRPNALIVAGDIFDSVNPPATSQRRYFDFLARASAALPNLHIVIIAGNHDAGARLEAPAGLLESMRITVVGTVSRDTPGTIDIGRFIVPLCDEHGSVPAVAIAIPYLRPSDVPLVDGTADPYLDGIRELYRRATVAAVESRSRLNAEAAIIALGHCHVTGGTESRESERRLIIGGSEALNSDVFPRDLTYVALGHLHQPQSFDGGRIRYSGSAIPLSFTETKYQHQAIQLTFDAGKLVQTERLIAPRAVELVSVPDDGPASIDDVITKLDAWPADATLPPERFPFLEVRVLDDRPDPTRRRRIEQTLEGKPLRLALIRVEPLRRPESADGNDGMTSLQDLSTIDPEDILRDAFRERFSNEADESLLEAFREIALTETTHG